MHSAAPRLIVASFAGLGLCLWLLMPPRSEKTDTSATPSPGADLTAQLEDAPQWSPEQVFRRAFWRQPSAEDRIVQAERVETPLLTAVTNSGSRDVQNWRWAIAVHPGPELLAALRDPETFGLLPAREPRPWTETPEWFPATAATGFEVLQASAGRLTVLYRAADNLLYAADAGSGFAPPAR